MAGDSEEDSELHSLWPCPELHCRLWPRGHDLLLCASLSSLRHIPLWYRAWLHLLGLLGLSFQHTSEQMPELGTEPCFISWSHQKHIILVSVRSMSEKKSVFTPVLCQVRLSQWSKHECLSCSAAHHTPTHRAVPTLHHSVVLVQWDL